MVNHVRTLLLNLPALAGEEYIPAAYIPVELPQLLREARRALLGDPPDRTAAAARVDRLLTYAHASRLAPDITETDVRITYDTTVPATSTSPAADSDRYTFAAAGLRTDLDDVFSGSKSAAELRWYQTWTSAAAAPDKAVALALALAARTAELAGIA